MLFLVVTPRLNRFLHFRCHYVSVEIHSLFFGQLIAKRELATTRYHQGADRLFFVYFAVILEAEDEIQAFDDSADDSVLLFEVLIVFSKRNAELTSVLVFLAFQGCHRKNSGVLVWIPNILVVEEAILVVDAISFLVNALASFTWLSV